MPSTNPIEVPIVGKDKLSKEFNKIHKRAQKFAAGMQKAGRALTLGISAPLIAAGGASVGFALELNKGMAGVATLIPNNRKRIEELKGSVQDLAMDMGKSTTDITAGLYDTVSAFGDSADSMAKLRIAATAAVAGNAETAESVKLLSAVTKGYGDTTLEATQQASDLAFLTVKLGQTTFPELAASIGKVVPLAKSLNVGSRELFGTFATMTGVTGNAAEVSTQLASIFSATLKPTKEMTDASKLMGFATASTMFKQQKLRKSLISLGIASSGPKKVKKALKAMGFASFKAAEKQLGFEKVTKHLNSVLEQNDDKLAKIFGRKEGLIQTLSLLSGQSGNWIKKLKAMNNEYGQSDLALKQVTQGVNATGHAWEQTKVRFTVFAQRVGDKLLPVLERLFKQFEPWLEKLEKMDDATLEWGLKMAGLAITLGPVLIVMGKMTSGVFGLMKMFGKSPKDVANWVNAFGNLSGSMAGASSKGSKLLRLLGKFGLLGAAAGGGYLLGTLISELFLQPHSQMKAAQFTDVQNTRIVAEDVAKSGARTSIVTKVKEAKKVEAAMAKLPDTMLSFENGMGMFASVFTGAKSPVQKTMEEIVKLKATQGSLVKAAIEQSKSEIKKAEGRQETLKIKFEADIPGSVSTKSSVSRLPIADTGAIMGGGL